MSAFDRKSPPLPARMTEVMPSTAAGFVAEKCMLTFRNIQQHAARGIAR